MSSLVPEAGKTTVQLAECRAAELFGALRGMFRPMQAVQAGVAPTAGFSDRGVPLVFGPTEGIPPFVSDEAKVSQILRNFVSNALKFTERGGVTLEADVLKRIDDVLGDIPETSASKTQSPESRPS